MHRLLKEVNYYKKEVEENEAKLALLKEEKRDIYDIKKFEEVLGESYMMVPESEGRLKRSLEDLASFLVFLCLAWAPAICVSEQCQKRFSHWLNHRLLLI